MPDNPFLSGSPKKAGRLTVADLEEHVDWLNRRRFISDSGLPYFVNKRIEDDSSVVHFVDRKTHKQDAA